MSIDGCVEIAYPDSGDEQLLQLIFDTNDPDGAVLAGYCRRAFAVRDLHFGSPSFDRFDGRTLVSCTFSKVEFAEAILGNFTSYEVVRLLRRHAGQSDQTHPGFYKLWGLDEQFRYAFVLHEQVDSIDRSFWRLFVPDLSPEQTRSLVPQAFHTTSRYRFKDLTAFQFTPVLADTYWCQSGYFFSGKGVPQQDVPSLCQINERGHMIGPKDILRQRLLRQEEKPRILLDNGCWVAHSQEHVMLGRYEQLARKYRRIAPLTAPLASQEEPLSWEEEHLLSGSR